MTGAAGMKKVSSGADKLQQHGHHRYWHPVGLHSWVLPASGACSYMQAEPQWACAPAHPQTQEMPAIIKAQPHNSRSKSHLTWVHDIDCGSCIC